MRIDESRRNGVLVSCVVKISEIDEWIALHTESSNEKTNVVKNLSDLQKSPKTNLKEPSWKTNV